MLARTFMTAKQLRCSEIERQAAIRVLDRFESGKVTYLPWREWKSTIPTGYYFNIGRWFDVSYCGDHGFSCLGCFGGYMEFEKGRELAQRTMSAWTDLFEPECCLTRPELFTVERATRALRAKLETGKADWGDARRDLDHRIAEEKLEIAEYERVRIEWPAWAKDSSGNLLPIYTAASGNINPPARPNR
jgi:hypothetical protein